MFQFVPGVPFVKVERLAGADINLSVLFAFFRRLARFHSIKKVNSDPTCFGKQFRN